MNLTEEQRALVNQVVAVLERDPRAGAFGEDEIAPRSLMELVEDHFEDLTQIGLYLCSMFSADYPLSSLLDRRPFAENYSRYPFADFLASGEGAPPALLRDESRFKRSWEQLTERWQNHSRVVEALTQNLQAFRSRVGAQVNQPAPSPGAVKVLTVIVHGTHAANQSWWQQGVGNFWAYIDGKVSNLSGGPNAFSWSGSNRHPARLQAAKNLVVWANGQTYEYLDLIAHSHGGNVCFLASRSGLKIRKLITLGTPIRTEYPPDLRQIDTLHNIYSTHDRVQTPTGTLPNRRGEGRSLGDTKGLINHRADDDGQGGHPGHSDLHEKDTWVASDLDALVP